SGAAQAADEASAGDTPSWMTGSLRSSYWSGSRNLDDLRDLAGASLWLKAEPRFGGLRATFDGWIRNDDLTRAGQARARLREAYVEISAGQSSSVRVGQQVIAWGRADQINPTDNLTPRDFTLNVPDTADDRLGTLATSLSHRMGDYT